MGDFPKIISVDDHVIEPRQRLAGPPARRSTTTSAPASVRAPMGEMNFVGGKFSYAPGDDGALCDWWLYEDKKIPTTRLSAAVGFDRDEVKVTASPTRRCARAAGTRRPASRTWTPTGPRRQMCFPSFPRFCGQTFMEAQDKELAGLCVQGLQRLDGRGVVR